MIAGFIFLRLRGILGKRTGYEGKSPAQFQEVLKKIKVDQNKAEIYSKTKQVYRKISQVTQTPTSSKWLCADSDGTHCHLYVFYLKEKPGVVFIGVEYSDLTWYYTTHFE